MACDILIHHGTKVPVGKDQEQHLEMTRTFGNRFNRLYNVDYFKEAFAFSYSDKLVKVPGLAGQGKMGKSNGEADCIYLSDSETVIRKKVMRAVSDSGPTEMNQPKPEAIQNLFDLMKVVSTADTLQHFDELYNKCEIRYGDFKKQLAEDMVLATNDVRSRIEEISNDDAYIAKVAKMGAEKASESARKTLKEVREIIGIRRFY
jgi:tryptophanyl-tRNA synthetase